jgi:hypothetical protein
MKTMTTPTITPAEISATALRLNAALKTQSPTRPYTGLDRCDRCIGAAQSKFEFKVGHVMFCGAHMRSHLDAMLNSNLVNFWIEPCELWSIKGIIFPAQGRTTPGDGLTDA